MLNKLRKDIIILLRNRTEGESVRKKILVVSGLQSVREALGTALFADLRSMVGGDEAKLSGYQVVEASYLSTARALLGGAYRDCRVIVADASTPVDPRSRHSSACLTTIMFARDLEVQGRVVINVTADAYAYVEYGEASYPMRSLHLAARRAAVDVMAV